MSRNYKIHDQQGVYFITFTIVSWIDVFTRPVYKDLFLESVQYCQENKGFKVHAYCIMTNHVHFIASAEGNRLSDIIRDLKQRGLLFHQEQYVHDYPFCWRAEEDPLIQYPRESWFIRTTAFKDELLANNNAINWLPEHIKTGRMGKFLESNVDWALSRERYWGTPLPVWQCEETGFQEAVGSYDELLSKPGLQGTEVWKQAKAANPKLAADLCVHKPYIDAVTYDSPKAEGARMRRVPDVIDCWYDSGAMPYAQWGYHPELGRGQELFERRFPADHSGIPHGALAA